MHSTTESTAKFWDSGADRYDVISKRCNYLVPKWISAHAAEIQNISECRVLDLACGTGANVRALSELHPGIRAEGIDISPKMVEHARATGRYEKLYTVDLEGPLHGIPSDTFDLVLACGFLEYLTDVHGCLSECRRVLKINGKLWATFRRFEGTDPFSPPRTMVDVDPLRNTGHSASEILYEMSCLNMRVTTLESIAGYLTLNGFVCPYYVLQAYKVG